MGDISGWELGATYVSRSSPRIQDTVVHAQCNVAWSERWGRHMPADWMSDHITVIRHEFDHDGNPAWGREVTHCTPFDGRNWRLADPDAAAWPTVRTVPGGSVT